MKKILIVGAGLAGCTAAHLLKNKYDVTVIDSRDHIGGNCYTYVDPITNVIVHRYGPHIFHTDDDSVWNFVNKFAKFMPYVNRVKATTEDGVFSLPINLHTMNQFFGTNWNPNEAMLAVEEKRVKYDEEIENFEEQALSMIGFDLYEAFIKSYTEKQWGRSPTSLPASILKRLPLRFNYDDNYFNHKYQGIPEFGYTPIFEKMLEGCSVFLGRNFRKEMLNVYDFVFYSGKIDTYFDYVEGDLAYRTLDFEITAYPQDDYLGCAVMNFPSPWCKYTRKSEHKHFAPWRKNTKGTVVFTEYPREAERDDIPYYPVRLAEDKNILKKYEELAAAETKTVFIGRLGTYRYLDMDVTIKETMEAVNKWLESQSQRKTRTISITC